MDSFDLKIAKVKLAKQRDSLHARNARRKIQTTTSKAARIDKVGVNEIKLVVDNSKRVIQVNIENEDDELSFEGWSRE